MRRKATLSYRLYSLCLGRIIFVKNATQGTDLNSQDTFQTNKDFVNVKILYLLKEASSSIALMVLTNARVIF